MMKSQTEASRALTLYAALQFDLAQYARRRASARAAQARGELLITDRQGLVHGDRQRGRGHRRAGARRHGLHRGDRRGAVRARRAHHHHLRGHDRHPVERSHRPQARPRPRRGHVRAARRHGARARGARPAPMRPWRAARRRRSKRCGCCAVRRRRCSATLATRPDAGMAVSVPYLKLCGYVVGGWLLAKSAALAGGKQRRRGARVLCRQDPHRGVLRRAGAAERGGARARRRGRRRERHRDRRGADLRVAQAHEAAHAARRRSRHDGGRGLVAAHGGEAAAAPHRGARFPRAARSCRSSDSAPPGPSRWVRIRPQRAALQRCWRRSSPPAGGSSTPRRCTPPPSGCSASC